MAKKEMEISVAEVVDYLKITGVFAPALQGVVRRKITTEAAKKSGIKVSNQELQKAADVFRIINRLTKAEATEKWLRANGITLEALEDYLEANLLINKFKDGLEKKADKGKYLSSPELKELIKDMIYDDWLKKEMK